MIPKDIQKYYELHSMFYDYTRWAFLFGRNGLLKSAPDFQENANVLDIGCGTGKHLNKLRRKYPTANIFGVDQSASMLEYVSESEVQLINEAYSYSLFPDQYFDLIICSYSLSMFQNLELALDAIFKHLKQSGMLLVVDFDSSHFSWFESWMKRNHVHLNIDLFDKLSNNFDIEFTEVKRAYFGLYNYTLFFGKNW